mgnify:CR=1 FL=1
MAGAVETPSGHVAPRPRRRHVVRAYELLLSLPLLVYLGYATWQTSTAFLDWKLLVWAGAIALVHLMPMPRRMPFPFSLSFPLQLSVALIYPAPVAGAVARAEDLLGGSPMILPANNGAIWSVNDRRM